MDIICYEAKSEKIARAAFRSRVEALEIGAELGADLMAVLQRHPNWAKKTVNVSRVVKAPCEINHMDWEIQIERTDGTRDDISWVKAIKALRGQSMTTSHHLAVRNAARTLVHVSQILPAREELGAQEGDHIDHIIDFEELFRSWMHELAIEDDDIVLRRKDNYKLGKFEEFADPKLSKSWQNFHRTHARLRKLDGAQHMKETGLKKKK